MKNLALIVCLLCNFSLAMIQAQTTQLPAALISGDNHADYALLAEPMPGEVPAEPASAPGQDIKISMTASPNPFTNQTVITCELPSKGKLTLGIRNMFGETAGTFECNVEQEGTHSVELTSEHLRPGIYTAMLVFKTSDNVLMKTIRIVYTK